MMLSLVSSMNFYEKIVPGCDGRITQKTLLHLELSGGVTTLMVKLLCSDGHLGRSR